ncbi:DUF6318 family protein, partial [Winkia neuii]
PLLPVQAQNNTQEGAIATGKFFIEAHDYAIQTGDMQPLHEVLLKDGDANESIKELEKRLNEKGTWVGEKATKELVAVEPQNDESFFLQFLVTQPPHTHSTNKTEKAPKKKFDYAMNLVYKSDRWQIKSLASRYANDEEGQDNGSH